MTATLPNKAHITLSEALTWLAFASPVDRLSFNKELAGPAFGVGLNSAKLSIEQALQKILDAACSKKVEMLGKHLPSHLSDPQGIKIAVIPPVEFQNYRQFDITIDGLRFGQGLAWLPDDNHGWQYKPNKRPDSFAYVLVSRAGLMRTFNARSVGTSVITNRPLPPISDRDLKRWWKALKPHEKDLTQDDLWKRCSTAFPSHKITRARIRQLTPDRKRGPKPKTP